MQKTWATVHVVYVADKDGIFKGECKISPFFLGIFQIIPYLCTVKFLLARMNGFGSAACDGWLFSYKSVTSISYW